MGSFVLVHGAWFGGWIWRPVRAGLEARSYDVHTPTSPGLHPGDPARGVTVQSCVDSLVDYLEAEDLRDVTLVAHSWGGFVASGAAPRVADRLGHLVMVSAFVPAVGESLLDLVPTSHASRFDILHDADGPYALVPPFETFRDLYAQDLSIEQAKILYGFVAPQPLTTFSDPTTQEMDIRSVEVPKTYVLLRDDHGLPADQYWVPRFSDGLGGGLAEIPGGHLSPFVRPEPLVEALLTLAP
jgi:pimeloyl-ACP methyl ester carboxylesterase